MRHAGISAEVKHQCTELLLLRSQGTLCCSQEGGEGKKKNSKKSKLRRSMQWPAEKKSPSFTTGVILIFLCMEIFIFLVLFAYINDTCVDRHAHLNNCIYMQPYHVYLIYTRIYNNHSVCTHVHPHIWISWKIIS